MADKINQIEIGGVTYDLQDKKSIFTGTATEYEAVADTIEDGTVVNITDDCEDGTPIGVEITNKIESLENELEKTNTKVDTIIEKADLGIKETASGEEIHLTDSAEGKAIEFTLYGKATQNTTSGKNLIPYPYSETTHTESGITFTDNGDGSITVNGIATATADLQIKARTTAQYTLSSGEYVLSGSPSGGSSSTYRIGANYTNSSGSGTVLGYDYGSGVKFTIEDDTLGEDCYIGLFVTILSGATVENLTFYPMIRLASITDDTYEPYTGGIASPNPDYPQEIEVCGASGSVEVTSSNEDETKTTKATISTENGLSGIPVSSGGNYTDQNGQQWICDEVVRYADGSGAYIQRIKKTVLNGSENWSLAESIGVNGFYSDNAIKSNGIIKIVPIISDIFVGTTEANADMKDNQIKHGVNSNNTIPYIYLKTSKAETVDELKTFFAENNATCYYILKEPITTPLTAEELAEIATFYPVTNISNDFDCGMWVKYNADSKNYIDKKIAEMIAIKG